MKRIFEVYRYDPDKDAAPRMQTYEVELDGHERMLLDALVKLKKLDESIAFRRSCREGSPAAEEFVEDRSEGVDVGACVDLPLLTPALLG